MNLRWFFWNASEKRLRATWRIVAQALLFAFGMALCLVTLFLSLALMFGLFTCQGDGIFPQGIVYTQLNAFMDSVPFQFLIIPLFSLLNMVWSTRFAARFIDKREIKTLGLNFGSLWWRDLGFGLILGVGMILFVFLALLVMGFVQVEDVFKAPVGGGSFWWVMFQLLVGMLCVGVYEEMLTRGYQLINLVEGLHIRNSDRRWALAGASLLTSLLFGFLHFSNPNAGLLSMLIMMVVGLFLSMSVILTGELGLAIGFHIAWNFTQGGVIGLPVSGLRMPASVFSVLVDGPIWVTGGAFGPEAGILSLCAMGLGVLGLLWWFKHTRAKRSSLNWFSESEVDQKPTI